VAKSTQTRGKRPVGEASYLSWFDTTRELTVPGRSPMESKILDAARRCFLQYGPGKMSRQDVAVEARVSRGSVYKYYTNRETLIEQIKEFANVMFAEDLDRAMAIGTTLEDQVVEAAHLFQEYVRVRPNSPGHSQFVALELTLYSGPFVALVSTVIRRYLELARARGEVRREAPLELGAEWLARILISLVNNPAQAFDGADPVELERFVRAFAVQGLD
jgi:AcrR family transcriptional regulator